MTQAVPTPPSAKPEPSAPADKSPAGDSKSGIRKSGIRKSGTRSKLKILIPIAVLIAAAGFGLRYWLTRPDDSLIQLSGRIESYESDLGAKVGGKVELVAVREGDRVTKGQVVATLDDAELKAQLTAAKAQVAAAEQQVAQAGLQIDVVASQVEEARLTLQQSQGDTVGRVNQSEAAVAAAKAQLASAQAQVEEAQSALTLASADRDRFAVLVSQGAISQQQFDQTQNSFETAQTVLTARQAAVDAAQQQVSAAQGALTQAQTSEINPGIRTAQVTRSQKQQAQAQSQRAAAKAALDSAKAEQVRIEAMLANLSIISPIDGIVLTRTVEPGEVISPGATVLSVVNLDDVYLRGYVLEGQIGSISIGQSAQVFLDSAPKTALAAKVTAIDTEASFTPENIYLPEDRVSQVFGLKLAVDNPAGFAKPGMPADGQILLEAAESTK